MNVTKTGLGYHEDMLLHKNEWEKDHIEIPERLQVIVDTIREYGLEQKCVKLASGKADDGTLKLCAPQSWIGKLDAGCKSSCSKEQEELSSQYDDIYINDHSLNAARLAAGIAVNTVKAIVAGQISNGFALVRPPGHHAFWDNPCGFCLFNNVAISAKYAFEHLGIKRVLIVDWDIHAGQGTQYAFHDDPRCLFFSIHRYEHGRFWPNLPESNWDEIGSGEGRGFNINIPLNHTHMGDTEYIYIMDNLIIPMATEFNPEIVLVSAGFDSAFGDPEGEMDVTPACYGHMINRLMNLAQGKVCVVLEGGYFLDSLRHSAAMTLKGLIGENIPQLDLENDPHEDVQKTLLYLCNILKHQWSSCQSYFESAMIAREHRDVNEEIPLKGFYDGEVEILDTYPTRNIYAARPAKIEEELREKLKQIIKPNEL